VKCSARNPALRQAAARCTQFPKISLMNSDFNFFKIFVKESIAIIESDLNELECIAEKASVKFSELNTTIYPDDLNKINYEKNKTSHCSIPIAMVCFSVIDTYGQWAKKNFTDDFASSAEAFFTFLSKREDLKNIRKSEIFKESFRNNIMHSFFMKKPYTISYPSYSSNSLFIDIYDHQDTLNVKYLLKVVRNGMSNLIEILENENNNELKKRLFDNYKRWKLKNDL